MKRLTLFLATIMVIVMVNIQTYASSGPFAGGDGTAENPYQVSTISHLELINDFPDKNYILVNDISLEDVEWEPIGSNGNFSGHFDGNNHTLSNVNSVIILTNEGKIDNLIIKDTTINVINENAGNIINCSVSGVINGSGSKALLAIKNEENGIIDSCCVKGSVKSVNGGNISGSYSALGYVPAVAGLVSINKGVVTNSYSKTNIKVSVSCYSWLSGNCSRSAACYTFLGTLIGINEGHVANSMGLGGTWYEEILQGNARGKVYCGGMCGSNDNVINNSHFINTLNRKEDIGIPQSVDNMKCKITFLGWDFENIWAIDPDYNDGYPYLQWERDETSKPSDDEPTEEQGQTKVTIVNSDCTDDSIKLISHANINNNDTVDTFGTLFVPLWLFTDPSAQPAKVEYSALENPIKSGDTFGATLNGIPDGYQDMYFVGKSYIKLDDNTVIWSDAKKVMIKEPNLRKVAE